jgi:hypothetical protein
VPDGAGSSHGCSDAEQSACVSKPQDDQVAERLATGTIEMPLWGVSLSRTIADSYGTRFRFELAGPFPAIAAWTYSGVKAEELELITG